MAQWIRGAKAVRSPAWLLAPLLALALVPVEKVRALTAQELIAALPANVDRNKLAAGDIVWSAQPEREQSDRQLAALLLLRVPAPLSQVVDALEREPSLQMGRSLPLRGDGDWAALATPLRQTLTTAELKRLQNGAVDRSYNLDATEAARLSDGAGQADPMARFETAWRDILRGRFEAYRQGGVDAVAPYTRNGKPIVQPGRQLAASTESLTFLREHYPRFIDSLLNYPKRDPALREQFFVTFDREGERPLYVLKHWLADIRPDQALIAERQFYISNTLDSLQVVILCIQDGDATLVALASETFTGKVSVGGALAHRIGRQRMRKKIWPLFEALQHHFPVPATAAPARLVIPSTAGKIAAIQD